MQWTDARERLPPEGLVLIRYGMRADGKRAPDAARTGVRTKGCAWVLCMSSGIDQYGSDAVTHWCEITLPEVEPPKASALSGELSETIRELKTAGLQCGLPDEEVRRREVLRVLRLVSELPDPPAPKVDVVGECVKATFPICGPDALAPEWTRRVLRRYIELRGLTDPDL